MNLIKNKTAFIRFLAIVISLALWNQNSLARKYEPSFIVAKVNNKVITNLELQDRYRFILFASKIKTASLAEKRSLLNQIIDKMVDEELIRQDAERLNITTTREEIAEAIETVAIRQKRNAVQFKLSLSFNNISFENYAKQIDSELLWSKIISQVLRPRVTITESEIREFFEQRKFNINVRKLLIAQIFIPKSNNQKQAANIARKLVTELRKGADFENIVKHFSRDSLSVENNGEIGWVSQKDVDKRIYTSIANLKNGEYSNPVLFSDGYYIFKLIDSKMETKIEDQDLSVARQNIFVKKLQNLSKGYLMDLRKNAFVEINRKTLQVTK